MKKYIIIFTIIFTQNATIYSVRTKTKESAITAKRSAAKKSPLETFTFKKPAREGFKFKAFEVKSEIKKETKPKIKQEDISQEDWQYLYKKYTCADDYELQEEVVDLRKTKPRSQLQPKSPQKNQAAIIPPSTPQRANTIGAHHTQRYFANKMEQALRTGNHENAVKYALKTSTYAVSAALLEGTGIELPPHINKEKFATARAYVMANKQKIKQLKQINEKKAAAPRYTRTPRVATPMRQPQQQLSAQQDAPTPKRHLK